MTSWNHGKHLLCWIQFLNLKCYVFKMFLPNFNRIEWKMEKQQLFQNRLFLALFILTWEKYDVIVTSLLIWFGFFSSQIVHPIWKYLRTKFEQSNFKDKGVMEGGWKTHPPPPPQCYNETKKPSAYRVKIGAVLTSIFGWLAMDCGSFLWSGTIAENLQNEPYFEIRIIESRGH